RLEELLGGLWVGTRALHLEPRSGEFLDVASFFLRLGDEALTSRDEHRSPPLAELSLPRGIAFGSDDSRGDVVHGLVALGAHVDEAVYAVAERPERLAQLVHHVHPDRPLER